MRMAACVCKSTVAQFSMSRFGQDRKADDEFPDTVHRVEPCPGRARVSLTAVAPDLVCDASVRVAVCQVRVAKERKATWKCFCSGAEEGSKECRHNALQGLKELLQATWPAKPPTVPDKQRQQKQQR